MIAASLQASARAARAVKLSPTRSRLQVASFRSWLEPMSNDPFAALSAEQQHAAHAAMTAVLGTFSSGVRLRDPRCIPRGDIVGL
jgi:hypothetical protein